MSPITDAPDGILRWSVRPGRSYVLEAAGLELGRLAFSRTRGSLAQGMTAHGEWTFKREGFLHPRITVRKTGEDGNTGALTLAANGNGKLTLSTGEEFNFLTSGWLQSHWSFNRGLVEIVRFGRDGSSADVEVVTPKVSEETLSVLILLGWYAPLLAADEAAVIAATMAACTAGVS
jgi:hypothetical protein